MGYRIDNGCVGCERCIHCSRGKDYKQYYCDDCKDEENKDNPMFRYGNKDLCWECYKKQFHEKYVDDCDDTRCSECGYDQDYMYEVSPNTWVCENCLKDMAERVNI